MKASRLALVRISHLFCFASALLISIAPYDVIAQQATDKKDDSVVCRLNLSIRLAMLTATVTDVQGRPVTNISHSDFVVFDGNELESIAFFTDEDQPVSVGILIDMSMSVNEKAWFSAVCQGILRFKEEGNQLNNYFVMGVSGEPQLAVDWTRDTDALIEGLSGLAFVKPKRQGAVNDACHLAIEKTEQNKNTKKVILLISSGQDSASHINDGELHETLKSSDVLVYTISLVGSKNTQRGQERIRELSVLTGGAAFFPSTANQIKRIFKQIALEIRHQYLIGYLPTNLTRRWHPVKIELILPQLEEESSNDEPGKRPMYFVRTRSGYYAQR